MYIGMFISTFSAILCTFKYYYKFQFKKIQKFYYPKESFLNTSLFKHFVVEFLMLMIHPSPFIENRMISFYNQGHKIRIHYLINDFPSIVIVISTLFQFLQIFNTSKYNSNRLQRINLIFFFKELNSFFPMKNFIDNNLIFFLIISLFLSIILFGALLNLTERSF